MLVTYEMEKEEGCVGKQVLECLNYLRLYWLQAFFASSGDAHSTQHCTEGLQRLCFWLVPRYYKTQNNDQRALREGMCGRWCTQESLTACATSQYMTESHENTIYSSWTLCNSDAKCIAYVTHKYCLCYVGILATFIKHANFKDEEN